MPKDPKLPFFAYGLFRPGQLDYFRIRNFVSGQPEVVSVKGWLAERDGIPLLVIAEKDTETYGMLIRFKEGDESKAYKSIAEIKPSDVYEWGEVSVIQNIKANALIGLNPLKGTRKFEDGEIPWDWKNDPYFREALDVIKEVLHENPRNMDNFKHIFRLQMAYGLLWTAIERYTGMKYNLSRWDTKDKAIQIFKEPAFVDGLKRHVSKDNTFQRVVNACDPMIDFTLDPYKPEEAIRYYYQIRCNSFHRGKTNKWDYLLIFNSLKELSAIFEDVLDEARRDLNQ